ncbi:MAG: sodium-dependent transporter [Clostridia bacterium]
MEEVKKRSTFSGKIGFVLAAAGSAVGLGNLWRFPYLAAKYGGGIFLLVYVLLAVTFGFALMVAEIAIGRKTGLSVVGAYKKLNKKWAFLGYISASVPIIILPYYSVIGGWVTKYIGTYVSGQGAAAANADYFSNFISGTWQPILWFGIFVLATALIVIFGVEKGVERVSKVMMPILVVLTIGIAIYVITRDGASEGLKYYFVPDFSQLTSKTFLAAIGQLFYSLSLAMGIMITYGSYMKKDVNIENSVFQIEMFDSGFALLAGLMIVPGVAVFSGVENLNASGPGLMFQVLPQVFHNMPGGHVIGGLFFVLVLFAALTSSISLMETVVSIFQDKCKLSRRVIVILVAIGTFLVGLLSSLGFGVLSFIQPLGEGSSLLDFFDFISNSVIMPIVALLTCIFVGYIIKTKVISDEVKLSSKFHFEKMFIVMTKYIAPIGLVLILVSSVLNTLGVITL